VSPFSAGVDALREAAEHGRICALAADGQRDLHKCAEAYPDLFPGDPFEPALFSAVPLATAFGAPWCTSDQLRMANRISLWIFAVDWLVDCRADSRDQVEDIVRRCLAIVDSGEPVGDPLTRFLADIHDELAKAPLFATLGPLWYDQLHRMMTAMAREWDWKSARAIGGTGPTFQEYLANADNYGSSLVNVAHWIVTGDSYTVDQLEELRRASGAVQQVLRLLNDLASYRRELAWRDLNALMLGVDRAEVAEWIAVLVDRCRATHRRLAAGDPTAAAYLDRQIGYSMGFYPVTDYWSHRAA
jgi:hypothetical protein